MQKEHDNEPAGIEYGQNRYLMQEVQGKTTLRFRFCVDASFQLGKRRGFHRQIQQGADNGLFQQLLRFKVRIGRHFGQGGGLIGRTGNPEFLFERKHRPNQSIDIWLISLKSTCRTF